MDDCGVGVLTNWQEDSLSENDELEQRLQPLGAFSPGGLVTVWTPWLYIYINLYHIYIIWNLHLHCPIRSIRLSQNQT